MAQRHQEESAAGPNRGAGFGSERTMEVNVIARIGGGVVFVWRAGKRRPAKADEKGAYVVDASRAANTLHMGAGE